MANLLLHLCLKLNKHSGSLLFYQPSSMAFHAVQHFRNCTQAICSDLLPTGADCGCSPRAPPSSCRQRCSSRQTPDSPYGTPCLCSWVIFQSTGFVESTRTGADCSKKQEILALILASTSDAKRQGPALEEARRARRAPACLSQLVLAHVPARSTQKEMLGLKANTRGATVFLCPHYASMHLSMSPPLRRTSPHH